ncbi:MAG: hypothetical protein CR982_00870 [Candidatus Cloacimonadota bacterium]|nr:MAG: hypothetical protein CR982_00870 [Candidatus Cloacimonadota bacterium]PIE78408.1 MAG: hypothetical protein CSA15_08020 [Candidatus Delongbacteria bacterium]
MISKNLSIEQEITNKVNLITISRFVLTLIAILLIFSGNIHMLIIAFAIMGFSEITDIFDGYIARRDNLVTNLGKILDPLSDSISRFFYFFALAYYGLFPIWFVIFFFFRDIIVAYVRIYTSFTGVVLAARISGKLKAAVQFSGQYLLIFILLVKSVQEGQAVSDLFLIWTIVIGLFITYLSLILFRIRGFLLYLVLVMSLVLSYALWIVNKIDYEFNYFTTFTISFVVVGFTIFSLIDYVMSLKNHGGTKTRVVATTILTIFLLIISPYSIDLFKNKFEVKNNSTKWEKLNFMLNPEYKSTIYGVVESPKYIFISAQNLKKEPTLLVYLKENPETLYKVITFNNSIKNIKDLEYFNNFLYIIDDGENIVYSIDIEKSLETGFGMITKSYHTGMSASGTLGIVKFNNRNFLIINDYFFNKELYFFDLDKISEDKTLRDQLEFQIETELYVKGINGDKENLFLLVNKLGEDLIYKVDLEKMIYKSSMQKGITSIIDTNDRDLKGITVYNHRILTYGKRTETIFTTKE